MGEPSRLLQRFTWIYRFGPELHFPGSVDFSLGALRHQPAQPTRAFVLSSISFIHPFTFGHSVSFSVRVCLSICLFVCLFVVVVANSQMSLNFVFWACKRCLVLNGRA